MSMDVSLGAVGTTYYLQLMGYGVGAHSINVGDQVIFLFDNDSTLAIKSPTLQGFDEKKSMRTYSHRYAVSAEDLEILSQYNLQALRKYSIQGHEDVYLEKKNDKKLKELSAAFLSELKKADLYSAKPESFPAGFPGGNDVFLNFLNRNWKLQGRLPSGDKTVTIQLQVMADGSIKNAQIKQSAGAAFDNEILRILKRMPKWKPAVEKGKQVDTIITLPLTFYLVDNTLKIKFPAI